MKEITFERTALYEEVWTTPLTQLGKQYGLSDNGLRKVCKALSIPLPRTGHWAKVLARQAVSRIPLPKAAQRTTFTSRLVDDEPNFRTAEDESWLASRIAFEENPENRIAVELQPSAWHRLVVPLRSSYLLAMKTMDAAKVSAERAEKDSRLKQQVGWKGWEWSAFLDRGQVLLPTHKSAPTRLTPFSYERALAVLNSLCREAERRNFTVSMNSEQGRIQIAGAEGTVLIRIAERLDTKTRSEKNSWDNKPRVVQYKVPSGELRVFVGERYSERDIGDGKDSPLESKLNSIFSMIYRAIVRQRESQRKHEAWHREYKAQEAAREAAESARRATAAQKERERRRRTSLLIEAKNWRASTLIRDYVSHLGQREPSEVGPSHDAWKSWALQVAGDLDPTMPHLAALQTSAGVQMSINTKPRVSE